MVCCSAYGCHNSSNKRVPGITFHAFPNDEERRCLWVRALRRKNLVLSKYSKICSVHFTEDMIDRTSVSCVRLRENAVPVIFEAFPQYLQNLVAVPKSNEESTSSDCELQLKEDSIVKYDENKFPDGTIQEIDQQIFSIKQEPVSDFELQEIEVVRENHDANKEIESSFTIEKIEVPNEWWAVSCTPKFIMCAKWDASYVCERKVVIEDSLNVKIFIKDHEIFDEDYLKLSSIAELPSLLCEVDRYSICPGIGYDKFKEKCLRYLKERVGAYKSIWCKNCRKQKKAIIRLQKNLQPGLTREERKEARIKEDKKRLKAIMQQNRRLKKRVERLKNRVDVLMHKAVTFDYDSTIEQDIPSDIDDIENEIDMESDIDDDDENIQSPISTSEMVANVFHVASDTDQVENTTRAKEIKITSDTKKIGNAGQNQSTIFSSDISKAKSVICNSPKTSKVKHASHFASGTDMVGQNQTLIAEIYIG